MCCCCCFAEVHDRTRSDVSVGQSETTVDTMVALGEPGPEFAVEDVGGGRNSLSLWAVAMAYDGVWNGSVSGSSRKLSISLDSSKPSSDESSESSGRSVGKLTAICDPIVSSHALLSKTMLSGVSG